jgi:hypothetical protein
VSKNPDGILGFSSTERYVTDIQTDRKMLRVVQGVIVSCQLVGVSADIVTDMSIHRMILPHILNTDLNSVLIREWH